jgi:hypothetical protein
MNGNNTNSEQTAKLATETVGYGKGKTNSANISLEEFSTFSGLLLFGEKISTALPSGLGAVALKKNICAGDRATQSVNNRTSSVTRRIV